MANHKAHYKQYLNGKHNNLTSFEIVKHPDAYIELLEDYVCENIKELSKREGYFIKSIKCVNKNIAGRTVNEWYQDNKTVKLAYQIRYYQTNIDRIKEHKNHKTKCDCDGSYTRSNKATHMKSKKHCKFEGL